MASVETGKPCSKSNSLPPMAMLSMKLEKTRPLGTPDSGATDSSVGYHRNTAVDAL
jgi:hypothetical protein